MLVNSKRMLNKARDLNYAVPAADVFNLESLKGVLNAAKECDSPLIIALAEVHAETLPLKECALLVKYFAENMEQDIVLHLDHGFTPSLVKEAVDCGFTSVMFDGSSLPYDENVRVTKEIVEYAKKHDVTVEAEIGHVGSGAAGASSEVKESAGEDTTELTTVEEAAAFAEATGVDSLAVSIGTAHGNYVGTPKLDFERLKDIRANIGIPLVLHGGSGTGYENLNKAVSLGISKVNIYTDLMNAAKDAYEQEIEKMDYFELCAVSQKAVTEKLKEYYEVFMTKKSRE